MHISNVIQIVYSRTVPTKIAVSAETRKVLSNLFISVQAEIFLFSDPTFLEGFDLKFHMPGHFPPWEVIFTYHPSHFTNWGIVILSYFCAKWQNVPGGKWKRHPRGENDLAYEILRQNFPEKWGLRKEKILPVHYISTFVLMFWF